jgi:ATP synthase protein I
MDQPPSPNQNKETDGMAESVRRHRERWRLWQSEGEPSLAKNVGQIGILGWMIVAPTLIGLFVGRWIDTRLETGVFWSAALLVIGVCGGAWSAWRWMHTDQ